MTLIVGVLCNGGVVVGSDGAATLGAMGVSTARQDIKKLCMIADRAIIARAI